MVSLCRNLFHGFWADIWPAIWSLDSRFWVSIGQR